MVWTPALTQLRTALEELFDSPVAIGVVLDEAGIPRARVNIHVAPTHAWQEVLTEAGRLGRVEALVAAARRQYPTNTQLAEAADLYLRTPRQGTFHAEGGLAPDVDAATTAPETDRSTIL